MDPAKDGQKFPREARIVRKAEYDAVYRTGKRRSSSHFTIFVRANELPLSRFGFSIKKALGGAVVRNRIRRRLRELVKRLDVISMRPHSDYVLVGRRVALTRDFATMLDDLRSALHRLDRQTATRVPQPKRMTRPDR